MFPLNCSKKLQVKRETWTAGLQLGDFIGDVVFPFLADKFLQVLAVPRLRAL